MITNKFGRLEWDLIISYVSLIIASVGLMFILSMLYNQYSLFLNSPSISSYVAIIGLIIGLIVSIWISISKFMPVTKFSSLNLRSKVKVLALLLIAFNWFLCSGQYLLYHHNKKEFIMNPIISNEIDNEITNLKELCIGYDEVKNKYVQISESIKVDSLYKIKKPEDMVIIDSSCLCVRLVPGVKIIKGNPQIKQIMISDAIVHLIGIDEFNPMCPIKSNVKVRINNSVDYKLSRRIKNFKDTTSYILGKMLNAAINDRIINLNKLIDVTQMNIAGIENRGLSFTSFVFRSFESNMNDIMPKNYYIRLLFYFQILFSIFIWGYITIIMYRIFDGKN